MGAERTLDRAVRALMRVDEAMRGDVQLVPPDCRVHEAARIMADLDARAILVGAGDVPSGILTDRDVIVRVVAPGRDPRAATVGEVMSSDLFTCRDDEDAAEVARRMREKQVRQMPVVDAAGGWVGLVTLEDLAGGDAV